MSTLASKQCDQCKHATSPMERVEAQRLLDQISEWEIVNDHHISKLYKFKNFVQALDFVNRVGEIAEEQGHHPDIYLTWGKARIDIWTHKVDGLTESDFVLAAKIDLIQ